MRSKASVCASFLTQDFPLPLCEADYLRPVLHSSGHVLVEYVGLSGQHGGRGGLSYCGYGYCEWVEIHKEHRLL